MVFDKSKADVYVKVTISTVEGIVGATIALGLFYGLWFGLTSHRRAQLKNQE